MNVTCVLKSTRELMTSGYIKGEVLQINFLNYLLLSDNITEKHMVLA